MRIKVLILCCAFMLMLCSCSKTSNTQDDADSSHDGQITAEQKNNEQVMEEPVYVSPVAEENFLLPIEDFSWEREHNPEYVVLHFTSNVVNNHDNPYNMEEIRNIFISGSVSINYIIDRDGNVQCWMPENRVAWHAGKGIFADNEKYTNSMNKYSIGIEIAAVGSQKDMAQYLTPYEYSLLDESVIGFTDSQYKVLHMLVRDVCERNGIPFDKEHVIGHDEYNEQKSDPGELFDWGRVFGE